MHKILLTPEGSLIPSQAPEYSNACMKRLSYLDVLIAPLEKRNLFRLIYHAPERLEDYSQVPDDYGKNLIEYQEYEVDVMTFYCDSVAWDGNPETRDETGDGMKENPWRNVNYALDQLQLSLDCTQKLCCNRPVYQLLIKGTINYTVGKSNADYNGYGRLILDVWQEGENAPDKWEVANTTVDFAGVTSLGGVYIYNCHVHDLEFTNASAHGSCGGIILDSDTDYDCAIYGCRISDLYFRGSLCGLYLYNERYKFMICNCHISNLNSEHSVTGVRIYHASSSLAFGCNVENIKVIASDKSYSRLAYGFHVDGGIGYLSACKVSYIVVQACALGDGTAYGFFIPDSTVSGTQIADCHAENITVNPPGSYSYGYTTNAAGVYSSDVCLYHCSFKNISGERCYGVYAQSTGYTYSIIYDCEVSGISANIYAVGFDAIHFILHNCRVSDCEASGNSATYRPGDDFTSSSYAMYGFFIVECTLISCQVTDIRAHSYLYGIYADSSELHLYGCSVKACSCIADASYRNRLYAYGIYGDRILSLQLYDCSISDLTCHSGMIGFPVFAYGIFTGISTLVTASEVDGCIISNIHVITTRCSYSSANAYGIYASRNIDSIADVSISNINVSCEANEACKSFTVYLFKYDTYINGNGTGLYCRHLYTDMNNNIIEEDCGN